MGCRYQKAFQDKRGANKQSTKEKVSVRVDECTLCSSGRIWDLACNCSLFVEVLERKQQQIQQSSGLWLQDELMSDSSLCVFLGGKLPAKSLQVMLCRPALSARALLMQQKQHKEAAREEPLPNTYHFNPDW